MRRFFSYGPVDKDLHYYVPRQGLVDRACGQLLGENSDKGGHYITVWAPRQRGKTWVMQQVKQDILRRYPDQFTVFDFSLGRLRGKNLFPPGESFPSALSRFLKGTLPGEPQVETWDAFYGLFSRDGGLWQRPLILLIDEVDTLPTDLIDLIVAQFRELYLRRETNWLHGLALIGVRAALGVDSSRGSPFNVQRDLHIPNLTFEEVDAMYRWYERESGQPVEQAVIDRVFYETGGQPGLVSWLGELLTETYNKARDKPITLENFEGAFAAAQDVLPNNNILNIISKARQEPYKSFVLEMFQTSEKIPFKYADPRINFLYLNGVVDWEKAPHARHYVKFSCPFVQKQLFDYFALELFGEIRELYPPFEDLADTITEQSLNVGNLLSRYEEYLQKNRTWLFKDAPRRADLRLYEAVYHFNFYRYLSSFLESHEGQVWPEFPTGNGEIDLIIKYAGDVYGLEVKSFTNQFEYRKALRQAARYGQSLRLAEVTLVLFVESVDDANRARYEALYEDEATGVTVRPVFVATGGE